MPGDCGTFVGFKGRFQGLGFRGVCICCGPHHMPALPGVQEQSPCLAPRLPGRLPAPLRGLQLYVMGFRVWGRVYCFIFSMVHMIFVACMPWPAIPGVQEQWPCLAPHLPGQLPAPLGGRAPARTLQTDVSLPKGVPATWSCAAC